MIVLQRPANYAVMSQRRLLTRRLMFSCCHSEATHTPARTCADTSSENCPSKWRKDLSLFIDRKKMQTLKKIKKKLNFESMIQNRCLVWLPSYRLNMISVWHIITGSVITDLCKQICHCRNTWPSSRAIMCPLHACTQVYFRCTKWKKNPQKTNKKKQ